MHLISSLAFIAYSLKWSFATFALGRSVRLCFHLERVQASCVLRPLVVTRGLCRCNPRSDINEGYCVCLYALLLFHCILTLQWLIQQNLFLICEVRIAFVILSSSADIQKEPSLRLENHSGEFIFYCLGIKLRILGLYLLEALSREKEWLQC